MERQQIGKTVNHHQESLVASRQPASKHASLHPLHQLRGVLGNRAFGRFIQAKLDISEPGDAFEQEADSVADTVMRMSDERADESVAINQKRPRPRQTSAPTASERKLQRMSGEASLQSELSNSTCASCSGEKDELRLDGLPEEVSDSLLLIDGPAPPEVAVHQSVSTPAIFRQALPSPNRVRVVQNHQVPITAAHVTTGWRSGFGGISEIEVSNGTTDYDGSNISEHFIGGFGNNAQIGGCANQTGQGGQGGSTFTVGDGIDLSPVGLSVSLPPKHNTFYDAHIKGARANFLPAGTNSQFSLCVQRYSFGGNTIWGRLGGLLPAIFFRLHNLTRRTVGGQDVADIDLSKF